MELLLSCLRLVSSDDVSVASKASKVFLALARQGDQANVLVSSPFVDEMRIVSQKNDIVRFRIYDIVVTYCCASEEKLMLCEDNQLLESLLGEVSTDDILLQLNALELLTTFGSCKHGREYLERKGTIQKLAKKLDEATADPLASLLIPGLMKFFGVLAHFQPDILSRYSSFTNTMFNSIDDSDPTLRMICIETLSFIATGSGGKLALRELGTYIPLLSVCILIQRLCFCLGSRMDNAVKTIGSLFTHGCNEVRLKALHSFAELIRITPAEVIVICLYSSHS